MHARTLRGGATAPSGRPRLLRALARHADRRTRPAGALLVAGLARRAVLVAARAARAVASTTAPDRGRGGAARTGGAIS